MDVRLRSFQGALFRKRVFGSIHLNPESGDERSATHVPHFPAIGVSLGKLPFRGCAEVSICVQLAAILPSAGFNFKDGLHLLTVSHQ
jgi:hypothetical protein